MSIVIFNHLEKEHTVTIWINNLKKEFGEKGSIYDYSCQSNLQYLNKEKSSRIYEGVLDYCENNKINNLIIPYLFHPEFLLCEINSRKKLKTKISFVTSERLLSLSKSTTNTYIDLLNKEQIFRMLVVYSVINFPKKLFSKAFFSKGVCQLTSP